MNSSFKPVLGVLVATLVALGGCILRSPDRPFDDDWEHYQHMASHTQYEDVELAGELHAPAPRAPLTLADDQEPEMWELTLQEAIELALMHSTVLRDLGAAVVQAPDTQRTIHDPGIREMDPRFGPEAALSDFDAQFATSAFFEKNDRFINNTFAGGGTNLFQQDLMVFQSQLSKRAVTGSEFWLRKNIDYDANNAPGNMFPSFWETRLEAEVRHPLMQGSGVQFNRIAGPLGIPGQWNGVLLARLDTEVSLADFELALRDLVSNVENAYWELYFAYRDLDAKRAGRDAALETWQKVRARLEANRVGGTAEREAQAREQYYRFQEEVQTALAGRPLEGTRARDGSTGGTFRGLGGVQVAERRLRLLLGQPISDGRLIRPVEEPSMARVLFDWNAILAEGLTRRGELRRQHRMVQRRELELIASRNFLLPRVDTVGRYRWRGAGDDLLHPSRAGRGRFDNAFMNLTGGDFQEWQLGVEVLFPVGFRRAHAAVRHAQLQLARERALLEEQQRQVTHDLSNGLAELDRAYAVAQTNYNRLQAVQQEVTILTHKMDEELEVSIDQFMDAQRRLVDADSRFHRSLVEYISAVKNVHVEKGSLLDYNSIFLAEGPWPGQESLPGYHPPVHMSFEPAASGSEPAAAEPFEELEPMPARPAATLVPTPETPLPANRQSSYLAPVEPERQTALPARLPKVSVPHD